MFKRVIWFGSGVASGVVGSWWGKRKVKQQVEKLSDPKVVAGIARKQATDAATTAVASAQERATTAAATASSTIDRYRTQARDKFFERRRSNNIRSVPDE